MNNRVYIIGLDEDSLNVNHLARIAMEEIQSFQFFEKYANRKIYKKYWYTSFEAINPLCFVRLDNLREWARRLKRFYMMLRCSHVYVLAAPAPHNQRMMFDYRMAKKLKKNIIYQYDYRRTFCKLDK